MKAVWCYAGEDRKDRMDRRVDLPCFRGEFAVYPRVSVPAIVVLFIAFLAASSKLLAAAPTGGEKNGPKAGPETQAAERTPPDESTALGSSEKSAHAGHAHIEKYPGKRPILVIEYPWKVHSRPSVELRMLEPREADRDPSKIHSLRFVGDFMKSEVTDAVYGARDHAREIPFHKKLAKFERDFEVNGQTNQLGKPGVTVTFPAQTPPGETVPRAVYFPLEPWAFDARTLRLELPADFSAPGQVRIWFLREANVLWEETVDWPGLAK